MQNNFTLGLIWLMAIGVMLVAIESGAWPIAPCVFLIVVAVTWGNKAPGGD